MTSQEKAFRDFAKFVGGLKGDEKSEAQTFLFFGLDVNAVGVEVAKVTLMLARRLAHRAAEKFWQDHCDALPGGDTAALQFETDLPLDNLDDNIHCCDALFTPWPEADTIIGNPPYLGSRYLAKELGYEYARKVHAAFPDVPKMADFCVHWFRLAHDRLPPNGRAGLVGTNAIRRNESREASLDYIDNHGGTIIVLSLSDDYSFGIIQSELHWEWIRARGGTQTARFTCTSDTVFDTFPWPQFPDPRSSRRKETQTSSGKPAEKNQSLVTSAATMGKIRAVAEASRLLRALRREIMSANGWSLRKLYRTLETPGENRLRAAHAAPGGVRERRLRANWRNRNGLRGDRVCL